MKKSTNIVHPLKNRSGSSQGKRSREALSSQYAAIDAKTLADRLYLIGRYAKLINYYEVQKDQTNKAYQHVDKWTHFFENSLPFQLAKFSKTSTKDLKFQFSVLHNALLENPSSHTLEAVLNFIYNEIILPVTSLYSEVVKGGNTFGTDLLTILKSSYQKPLKEFITLYNASVTFLCISKINFDSILKEPWKFRATEIFELNKNIQQVKEGKMEAYLLAGRIAEEIFDAILSGLSEIIEVSSDYIEESLRPLETNLQQKHEPHLALMFAFLEIFKHLQGNINELGKKHLDFFYKKVLKIIPKDAVPDKAHLVFEIAKHLENGYLLPKGLLLKDGKDANKQDIEFSMDKDLVINKAQIKELRSLSLFPVSDKDNNKYIEGIYKAPVANSLDGQGKKFKDNQSNWATLGDKFSKQVQEGNELFKEHPKARIGFVLASPVLLLEEGKRNITIKINCDIRTNETPLTQTKIYKEGLVNFFNSTNSVFENTNIPLFKVSFSGIKEWIKAKPLISFIKSPLVDENIADLQIKLTLTLGPDEPAVVFYNEENLEEKLDLKYPFPLVKIELNEDLKIAMSSENSENSEINKCCLRKTSEKSNNINISPYDFLQSLIIINAEIDVEVCGVKNLIVQNDDNLQDINKPIMPFGPRPKVGDNDFVEGGSNFYIGSKEVFCKNWQKIWINTTWKDKPGDIGEHYKFYKESSTDDSIQQIKEDSFKFLTSVLENGVWKKLSSAPKLLGLFKSNVDKKNCEKNIDKATFLHEISHDSIEETDYVPKSMRSESLEPLTINTRKGFARLTLAGVSFQHDRYSYVLARQMMALSGLMDPESIAKVQENLTKSELLSTIAHERIKSILSKVNSIINDISDESTIFSEANELRVILLSVLDNLDTNLGELNNLLNAALDKIDILIENLINVEDEYSIIGKLEILKIDLLKNKINGEESKIPDSAIEKYMEPYGLQIIIIDLNRRIKEIKENLNVKPELGIPMEPYTPLIKSLSIDYVATANKYDMEIVHLYPFENTSKHKDIEDNPTLLPYFEDEGALFIGLESVTPGGSLSLLFQLAEATADSEMDRAQVNWHYLANNNWEKLRPGYEVLKDDTDGLTLSGIVTIAVPDDISNYGHTIMPENLYWLKVSARENVKAIAETIGIHTQAALVSARLDVLSDKERLDTALPAGSIMKLVDSDFNVKKVEQLYDSFGGRKPEASGHFYVRVSEHLKHKGRGIMIADYENIVLESFPEIYKVKCISHSMGLSANKYREDLELAPGYLIVAVVPDLTKLKSGNLLTPKVPISLLEKIGNELRNKISPFARIKVMNPRYEPVNVDIKVRLHKGKSSKFYSTKLKESISQFLAPWYLGDSEKLAFGQDIVFSDLVGFIEQQEFIDFIVNLELKDQFNQNGSVIHPLTARTILTGGKICVEIDERK